MARKSNEQKAAEAEAEAKAEAKKSSSDIEVILNVRYGIDLPGDTVEVSKAVAKSLVKEGHAKYIETEEQE